MATNDRDNNRNAFFAGFNRAQTMTNREAAAALEERGLDATHDAVTCFQNGSDDGVNGDRFRVDLLLAEGGTR